MLHEAASMRRPDLVRMLLDAGADPIAEDGDGRRPQESVKGWSKRESLECRWLLRKAERKTKK